VARKIVWLTRKDPRIMDIQTAKEKILKKFFSNKVTEKRGFVILVLDVSD
jgi:DNA-directed RNA polymerase subunit E'/Rpb7